MRRRPQKRPAHDCARRARWQQCGVPEAPTSMLARTRDTKHHRRIRTSARWNGSRFSWCRVGPPPITILAKDSSALYFRCYGRARLHSPQCRVHSMVCNLLEPHDFSHGFEWIGHPFWGNCPVSGHFPREAALRRNPRDGVKVCGSADRKPTHSGPPGVAGMDFAFALPWQAEDQIRRRLGCPSRRHHRVNSGRGRVAMSDGTAMTWPGDGCRCAGSYSAREGGGNVG